MTSRFELIDSLIATHPDVIGVAADDPAAIVPVLKKAEAAHIKVMSWDGDANYRDFFVAMVDNDVMGREFCDEMARQIGPEGDVAIITSNFAAANQVAWIKAIKARIQERYPKMNILTTLPSEEDQQLAFKAAQDIIKSYPNVKGIFAVTTVALPGAAEAIKAAGLAGKIAVVGNSQPTAVRSLIKDGTVRDVGDVQPDRHGLSDALRGGCLRQGPSPGWHALQGGPARRIHAGKGRRQHAHHAGSAQALDDREYRHPGSTVLKGRRDCRSTARQSRSVM